MREEIQKIALERQIPFLVHFTRVENIASIMQHGLVPVKLAHELGITPTINDQMRLDGRLNGTSLSIAHPNGPMFYKLRQENPNVDWAILALHPSILWSESLTG